MAGPFPNVPNARGVPPLRRNPIGIVNDVTLLVADALFIASLFGPPRWGIYSNDGDLILDPDSIFAFSFRADFDLSTFPIEGGGFETYNKVTSPFGVKVEMTKGGSDAERHAFLTDARIVASTLGLYTIVTSDETYYGTNVAHWDFDRRGSVDRGRAEGVGLLTVSMWFDEVRVGGTASFQSTAEPNGADPQNAGTVQAGPTVYGDQIKASLTHPDVSVTPL